jgi:hypothetical protein
MKLIIDHLQPNLPLWAISYAITDIEATDWFSLDRFNLTNLPEREHGAN